MDKIDILEREKGLDDLAGAMVVLAFCNLQTFYGECFCSQK